MNSSNDAQLAESLLETIPSIMKVIRAEVRESGGDEYTVPQLRILAHVNRGSNTAVELADLQGVSLAAISKLVESLVAKGLLQREFKEGNRKQIFLRLTEKGREKHLAIRRGAQTRIARHFAKLPPSRKASMLEGLQSLNDLVAIFRDAMKN